MKVLDLTPAARLLGREIIAMDEAAGAITSRFVARPEFLNRHGTVQGGFVSAMLDSATGMALISTLPESLTAVTTRLDTRFLRPARAGDLTAKAKVVSRDAHSAEVEASLEDPAGTILATAIASLRIVARKA